MQRIFDCSVDTELLTGMRLAKVALGRTELVVLPTDTVYGIAANAFSGLIIRPKVFLHHLKLDRYSNTPFIVGGLFISKSDSTTGKRNGPDPPRTIELPGDVE